MVDKEITLAPEGLDSFLAETPVAAQPTSAPPSGVPAGLNDFLSEEIKEAKYGTGSQQLATAAEGAASAATFGLSTGIERMAGVKPEDIRARREQNPISHGVGQVAGLVGSSLIPGVGAANLMEHAGVAGATALGLGAAVETIAAKVGAATTRAAIENAVFQTGDELSKMITSDPDQSIGSAVADVGLAGLIGGAIGGGIGTVSPLWKATIGKETNGTLKAIADRLGGIEGQVDDPLGAIAARADLDLSPEVKSAMSEDVNLQNHARLLSQSDTTGAGKSFQESLKAFKGAADDSLVSALGKNPAEIHAMPELSKYESGKKLGKILADEFQAQVDPISAEYERFRNKYKDLELDKSISDKTEEFDKLKTKAISDLAKKTKEAQKALNSADPEKAIQASARLEDAQANYRNLLAMGKAPGTTDSVSEKIMKLADQEGWTASPSSDIMNEIRRIQKELPLQKNIKNLDDYIKAIGSNMQRDPMNGPLRRAGGMIKSLLKDAEAEVLEKHVGAREGMDALQRYQGARSAYAAQSSLKEALDSRLHVKGSTSGYAKALREAADTDGEALLRKLSGHNDADLLATLKDKFPGTAKALQQYHIDNLLQTAVDKARPGETINATALRNAINKMSPELRSTVIDSKAMGKIEAVGQLIDKLKDPKYNFSNTARTVDGLTSHIPGGITGLISALASGNIATGVAVGGATKYLTKDIPDYMRLALLKFLGTNKPIEPGAFRTAVEAIKSTIKGENSLAKATKDVFKASEKAIISHAVPSDRDRIKLDKIVLEMQTAPEKMTKLGSDVAYYMPEHGSAVAQTTVNALNYLNTQRPNTSPKAPLDSKLPPDPGALANYERMLDIANQPLMILGKVKSGSVTPKEVGAIKAMYPSLYNNMVSKLTRQMTDHLSKGGTVPYNTRIGLSLFGGMPLDSTLTGPAILAAQPKPMPQGPQASDKPPSATSTKGLGKMPKSYQTPSQAREQRAQKS